MPDEPVLAAATPWVRRRGLVWLGMGLIVLGAILHTIYLWHNCPFDLTEDEAHYWEWSRHLDYGYYSKPPGIAWVIAAAVKVGGALGLAGDGSGAALMPVVRMPAVLFGILSGLLSLFLARRMFRDDRVGFAVIILSAAVPMFAVGSLLITIDSPMYLCWSATVYCLWRVVEKAKDGGRTTTWLYAAGFCAAVGMLFKPVLIALPICAAIAARGDPVIRRAFKTWHAAGALLVMLCSQIPVVMWNSQHGWVTFRHILTQGGMGKQAGDAVAKSGVHKFLVDPLMRMGSYLGGQIGGMGGLIFMLLVLAVLFAWKNSRAVLRRNARIVGHDFRAEAGEDARVTAFRFLLSFTLPLWVFYFVMNLWKGTEVNWPAASYFTGMILLAGVVVEQWHSPIAKIRHDWRGWTTATVIWGILLTAGALNLYRLYPLAAGHLKALADSEQRAKSWWNPRKWDLTAPKLRGFEERAQEVEAVRAALAKETGQEPLIITGRYDDSSSLAFYMPGHPFVFCVMSNVGGRRTQYDLWPGLGQKDAAGTGLLYAGRPAVIVGIDEKQITAVMRPAFERVEGPQRIPVMVDGVPVREVVVYRAWGFRQWPDEKGTIY